MRSRSSDGNAFAVVFDDDAAGAAVLQRGDAHPPARVTDRVFEKVARQLAQPAFVAVDDRARRRAFDPDSAGARELGGVASAARDDPRRGRQVRTERADNRDRERASAGR